MEQKKINIFDVVGGKAAVSTEDGERLFTTISAFLEKDFEIVLDFANIETLITTFLNAAIGQLYSKYDSPFLREHLRVDNLAPEDRERMVRTIERAKEYFKDKENIEKDMREAFDDE
ncbi:MAG: STAS-like domain-containing protein [Deltaproteobacteria bacterium]|nr:STAS-like domain-containing protein [Deltaproteobacteria bacterium]